jgi:hypothetical protein
MATLGYQTPKTSGTTVNFVACASGGDKIPARGRGCVLVKNGDASSKTVTVAVPGNDSYGSARPDFSVVVAAGATVAIGPFDSDLEDPTDSLVHLTYSAVTSLSIAAIAA